LLIAADSLTSAMSSLVQQLNTGNRKEKKLFNVCSFLESTESIPTAVDNLHDTHNKNELNSINENKTNLNEQLFP
jgi:hypothetical protein